MKFATVSATPTEVTFVNGQVSVFTWTLLITFVDKNNFSPTLRSNLSNWLQQNWPSYWWTRVCRAFRYLFKLCWWRYVPGESLNWKALRFCLETWVIFVHFHRMRMMSFGVDGRHLHSTLCIVLHFTISEYCCHSGWALNSPICVCTVYSGHCNVNVWPLCHCFFRFIDKFDS